MQKIPERNRSRGTKKNGGHSKSQTRGDEENKAEKNQRPRRFVYKMKSSQSIRIGSRCTRINARA